MDNYYEIFLGGGSVLFGLLTLQKEGEINVKKKIYAYDYNKSLIYLYKNIQKTPKKFINTIIKIIN
jgi:DNA adenine methylase